MNIKRMVHGAQVEADFKLGKLSSLHVLKIPALVFDISEKKSSLKYISCPTFLVFHSPSPPFRVLLLFLLLYQVFVKTPVAS